MSVVIWILAGALLGGAANLILGTRGRTAIALNVATGVAGVVSGGWLLGVLTGTPAFNPEYFFLTSLLVSLMGATVLLTVLQLFSNRRTGEMAARPDTASPLLGTAGRDSPYHDVRTEMNQTNDSGRALRPLMVAAVAGILLLVGACASAPLKPDSALDAARVAISNADKAGAGQFANAELAEARSRLLLADGAVMEEDMVQAERFARESQVQAELASARTAAAKAAAVNRDMERGTEAMIEEMQRAGDQR